MEWPRSSKQQTADIESTFLTEEFLSAPCCPALLPLSVSVFLNDLYGKHADQFYDKEKLKFRLHHRFFLLADITISECSFDDLIFGVMALGIKESRCHFLLVTYAFPGKPLVRALESKECKGFYASHRSNFFKKNFE